MNNRLKKEALRLSRLFETEVGELPRGAVSQFGLLLNFYTSQAIEQTITSVGADTSLADSEAAFGAMRDRLRRWRTPPPG